MKRSFPHGVESLRSKQPFNCANSTYLKVYCLVHKTLQLVPVLIQINSVHLQLQLGPLGCHFWPTHFPCFLLALPISLLIYWTIPIMFGEGYKFWNSFSPSPHFLLSTVASGDLITPSDHFIWILL
jgi:hypothetical protein